MLCFVVVMQSFIINSHEVFIHIHQGCFPGTGAIVRLPQCQGSKPDGCGKISQCITTTKHSKAITVCIFLGIYCKVLTTQYKPILAGLRDNANNLFDINLDKLYKMWMIWAILIMRVREKSYCQFLVNWWHFDIIMMQWLLPAYEYH